MEYVTTLAHELPHMNAYKLTMMALLFVVLSMPAWGTLWACYTWFDGGMDHQTGRYRPGYATRRRRFVAALYTWLMCWGALIGVALIINAIVTGAIISAPCAKGLC